MNVPEITLHKAGKKFGREWIFRNMDITIPPGETIVILGGNGSGKSTLLQLISTYITPAEGKVEYKLSGRNLQEDEIFPRLSFASPYLQLPEDLTAAELVKHVFEFKKTIDGVMKEEVLKIAQLDQFSGKLIRQFSSGMKQRMKLALAFLSDSGIVLLDEPVSNLDRKAIEWYRKMVENYRLHRTVIVCSNSIEDEYYFCTRKLNVEDFKSGIAKK